MTTPARRNVLGAALAAAGVASGFTGAPAAASSPASVRPAPARALARLTAGNSRWATGALAHRDPADDRRRVGFTAMRQVRLHADPVLFPLVRSGRTGIVGGVYSLGTRRVGLV